MVAPCSMAMLAVTLAPSDLIGAGPAAITILHHLHVKLVLGTFVNTLALALYFSRTTFIIKIL
jgi:hypothetical protein